MTKPRKKKGGGEQAPPAGDAPRKFRDRIVGLHKIKASELRKNPKNWRVHDDRQRAALVGILSEVGFAGAALAFRHNGELVLIDGHLRSDVAEDEEIPVLETDLTEAEALKVLATHDVIGGLAVADAAALDALVAEIKFDTPELNDALDQLLEESWMALGKEAEPEDDPDEKLTDHRVKSLPLRTWVLVSIPTLRFGEIAEAVENISKLGGCEVFTTSTDE